MTSTVFTYRALDRAGHRHSGAEPAQSRHALAETLEGRGLLLLEAEPHEEPAGAGRDRPGVRARRGEVLELTRALAALLSSGVPLARALGVTATLTTSPVAAAVAAIGGRVERGQPMAAALGEYPALFPPLYVGLVWAGRAERDLAGAFRRFAGQLEQEAALRSRLLSAAIYPLVLAVAGGLAVVVLLFFVSRASSGCWRATAPPFS